MDSTDIPSPLPPLSPTTSTERPRVQPAFLKRPVANTVYAEFSSFYHMVTQYILMLHKNTAKTQTAKYFDLEKVGNKIGASIIQRVSEEKVGKATTRLDMMKLIGEEFWTFLFKRRATKIMRIKDETSYAIVEADFKLAKHVSSKQGEDVDVFVDLCSRFIASSIRGALNYLSLDCEVIPRIIHPPDEKHPEYHFEVIMSPKPSGA
eukprot:TRINITY_DN9004_c0_g1_i1.p1 TRINITY_DN9004_c0_g1~~TRINITY_DN9004_c0_g1_i1.p1  ORF type:complete len:206 (+),score=34.72 TRINITY_DN9004_c0_g1_i1:192-809(+)